jgi:long-chain acyl-CoA synthetase
MESKPWFQHYDPGIDLLCTYTTMLPKEQFLFWVNKQPERPYIYYLDDIITYNQANILACKLARQLQSIGMKKGDRLVLTLPNIPEFIIAVQACFKIGVIVVPTNPRYTERELAYRYANSGAKIAMCLAQHVDTLLELQKEKCPDLQNVIVVAGEQEKRSLAQIKGLFFYNQFLKSDDCDEPQEEGSLEDVAVLIYTGGTTGVSKGCSITNANLNAVALGWKQMSQYFTDFSRYKVLCCTPMYHIHGFQIAINSNILLGGSVVILSGLTPEEIIKAINRYEPNVLPVVPTLIRELMKRQDFAESKAHLIEHIGCGASPIPAAIMKEFENIIGVPIIEGYGASETTMAVSGNPMRKRKTGSVGLPYPQTDVKIVDIETGQKELPAGQIGELCFKGPQVIKEYWNNPKETKLAIKEGWWYSGDIGYMDEEGFLFLIDRKKDIINCSGFNVFSNEVDEVLNSHPKILEAGVVGIPDHKRGETVKAYVVKHPGEDLSKEEIKNFCRKYLTAYKVPREIEFIDVLPRTCVYKVDRKKLKLMNQQKRDQKSQEEK